MTLVTLPSPFAWPGIVGQMSGGPSLGSSSSLTAAGHYIAYVFCAKESMTLANIGFRSSVASGSPTMDVRIETVDTSTGFPTGALWSTNTNIVTSTLASSTWNLLTLTSSASIAAGQLFAVKLAYAAGTSININTLNNLTNFVQTSLPYQVTNTGSPARALLGNAAADIALGSSSTSFYEVPGTIPVITASAGSFNNTSSAKRGLRFTPPMNCRVIGIRFYDSSSTGDFNIDLYDSVGTTLITSTAISGNVNAASANAPITAYFGTPQSLTAGTTYRAVIEPTSATNVNVSTLQLPSASYRGASPAGTTALYTTYAGSWVDSATDTIPLLDLIIDQVDDGTGSGGGGTTVVGVIGG